MMRMKGDDDWCEDDATWRLLGEAVERRASGRFTDDTLRAVRLLPEGGGGWRRMLRPVCWLTGGAAVAACGVVAMFSLMGWVDGGGGAEVAGVEVKVAAAEEWVMIEEAVTVELLAAAADHPEDFSDGELVALIGF